MPRSRRSHTQGLAAVNLLLVWGQAANEQHMMQRGCAAGSLACSVSAADVSMPWSSEVMGRLYVRHSEDTDLHRHAASGPRASSSCTCPQARCSHVMLHALMLRAALPPGPGSSPVASAADVKPTTATTAAAILCSLTASHCEATTPASWR